MRAGSGGRAAIAELASAGLDANHFRTETLRRLRGLLSIDAAFYATVDPVTLLFTSAAAEEPLAVATPLFLENEFGRPDVNKFATLVDSTNHAASLDQATKGQRATSLRYQEVLAPLGLGDELRVALMAGGHCWGVLCLHREESPFGFSPEEIDLLGWLGPYLGEGLRRSLTLAPMTSGGSGGPGVIILGPDLGIVSINARAEALLGELSGDQPTGQTRLPLPILAAAAQMSSRTEPAQLPSATRLRTPEGTWITFSASHLEGPTEPQIAIILEPANPAQLSSLVLAAHGLTPAQQRVAALVIQGWSTHRILNELHISSNTLQEHLRAVFEKFGIGSRRELVAALTGQPH